MGLSFNFIGQLILGFLDDFGGGNHLSTIC